MIRIRRATLCVAVLAGSAAAPAAGAAEPVAPIPVAPRVPASVAPPGASWIDTVNSYRTQSGLQPVVEEPAWTAGLSQHIRYLHDTPPALRTGSYASAHSENPASPFYTPEGAEAAVSSNIGSGATARDAVDAWMAAPFHAIGIMRPNLTKSAFASDGTAILDVLRGLEPMSEPRSAVLFPGADSATYLTSFGSEAPDPREGCAADWTSFAGLPIFATLPDGQAPGPTTVDSGTTATLTRPDGTTITTGNDLCVQTGASFNSSDPVYGQNGKAILIDANAVLVIPRAKLAPGRHTVTITFPGRASIAWSFAVVRAPTAPAQASAMWAGSGKIRVSWNAPADDGGVPVTGYSVNALLGGDASVGYASAGANARAAIVNVPVGMSAGSVMITASNNVGPGPPTTIDWSKPRVPNGEGSGALVAVATTSGDGARAVLANVAMVDGVDRGYVTADRCSSLGDGPQSRSSGNHPAGQAVANLAVVALDELSSFCLYSQVPTHLVVDVEGSFSPTAALAFTPSAPTRVLDTRSTAAPSAGSITHVDSRAPPGTEAVLVNLTMAGAPIAGYITADACGALGSGQQTKSSGNHGVDQPVANLAVVPVDPDGRFCIYAQQATHLIVDVEGWFSPTGLLRFDPIAATRVLDTRAAGAIPPAGSIVRVHTGLGGASAVLVNIAMTDSLSAGYVTADRCTALVPGPQTRSTGNHGVGDAVSNLGVVPLDADGSFCIYTQQPTHIVVDVQGSFSASGALAFSPAAPTRVLDTRMP